MSGNRSRRDRAAAMIAMPLVRRIARRAPGWRGVLVLNYHRVGEHEGQPWDHTLWSASAEVFDEHLSMLADNAEVIGPEEVESAVAGGRRGRRVMLTFDDGYRDNFELAYPLLRQHGLSATFFLATGFLDRPAIPWWDEIAWMVRNARRETVNVKDLLSEAQRLAKSDSIERGTQIDPSDFVDLGQVSDPSDLVDLGNVSDQIELGAPEVAIATLVAHYKKLPATHAATFLDVVAQATGSGRCPLEAGDLWMTWDMAREMRAGGMAIGGHTVTHPVLSSLPVECQREEIEVCGQRLEQELGEPMQWFAYPVGAVGTFTQETRGLLQAHGVRLAFSFYGGHGRFVGFDPLDVPRVHVGRSLRAQTMRAMVLLPSLFARW